MQDDAAFCSACGKRVILLDRNVIPSDDEEPAAGSELARLLDKESRSHSSRLQYQIGDSYFFGKNGAKKDCEKAVYWLEQSANKNYDLAQYALASCYANGLGVQKNEKMAFMLYSKAAENGNKAAMFCLAQCYEDGKGVQWDLFKAVTIYLKLQLEGEGQAEARIRDIFDKEENILSPLTSDFIDEHTSEFEQHENLPGVTGTTTGFYTDDVSVIAHELVKHRAVPIETEDGNYLYPLTLQVENLSTGIHVDEKDFDFRHRELFHFKTHISSINMTCYSLETDGKELKDYFLAVFNYETELGPCTLYLWGNPTSIQRDKYGLYEDVKNLTDMMNNHDEDGAGSTPWELGQSVRYLSDKASKAAESEKNQKKRNAIIVFVSVAVCILFCVALALCSSY
ncbi:MAG: sel1 repeat family protein [Treponema sp.]|nr:sel1 repeat family protein [Treponema sp.]